MRPNTVFHFVSVSALDILTQIVHVILGLRKSDGEHKFSLWCRITPECRKLELGNLSRIEQVDNFATINTISRQSVGMPCQNPICFTLLDTQKHFIKDWPTRDFGGLFFHKDINNLDIFFYRQFFQLGQLIRNASHLPILRIGTFTRVDEEFSGVIHKVALANEEPRSAWRILSDWGFRGGNAVVSRDRRDAISLGKKDLAFLRCILDEVRMYFAENPE